MPTVSIIIPVYKAEHCLELFEVFKDVSHPETISI